MAHKPLPAADRPEQIGVGIALVGGQARPCSGLRPDSRATGTRFSATVTPWASLSESSSGFVIGEMTGAVYHSLGTPRVVVAGRARLGSILAGDLHDIPANKHFYAGGGASINANVSMHYALFTGT